MRKIRVKKLRDLFEKSDVYIMLKSRDQLRSSPIYKTEWRSFKKSHKGV